MLPAHGMAPPRVCAMAPPRVCTGACLSNPGWWFPNRPNRESNPRDRAPCSLRGSHDEPDIHRLGGIPELLSHGPLAPAHTGAERARHAADAGVSTEPGSPNHGAVQPTDACAQASRAGSRAQGSIERALHASAWGTQTSIANLPGRKVGALVDNLDGAIAQKRIVLVHCRQHRLLQQHRRGCQYGTAGA